MKNKKIDPNTLKIMDVRFADIDGAPKRCTLVKVYTNQGLVGYGEVRDASSRTYAAMLKSRILGENPCNVEKIFRRIKQFGGDSRQAGGVCALEVACWDLAGKAWGVPVWQMLGGKFRDKIRLYCDTDSHGGGRDMGKALANRMKQGYTFLKMDLGIELLMDAFTGIHLTEKGLDFLEKYMADCRAVTGYEIPIAIDHLGHIPLEDCIKLARRLEKFNLAWMEDAIPWQLTDQWVRLAQSTTVPLGTGEDMYLKESFEPLFKSGALAVVHPDVLTAGGILETKKIGDMAEDYGVQMSLHMAESPIGCMAAVHVAAATRNFMSLEVHSVDVPWWKDLIKPSLEIKDGYIDVPNKPGLGIDDLNEELIASKLHKDFPEAWASTEQWDKEWANDRQWS